MYQGPDLREVSSETAAWIGSVTVAAMGLLAIGYTLWRRK